MFFSRIFNIFGFLASIGPLGRKSENLGPNFLLHFLITFLIQKIDFWSTCLGEYFVALLGYPGLNLGFLCFPEDFQGFRWFKLGLNLGFLCFSKDFQGFRWFRPGLNLASLCFS